MAHGEASASCGKETYQEAGEAILLPLEKGLAMETPQMIQLHLLGQIEGLHLFLTQESALLILDREDACLAHVSLDVTQTNQLLAALDPATMDG